MMHSKLAFDAFADYYLRYNTYFMYKILVFIINAIDPTIARHAVVRDKIARI